MSQNNNGSQTLDRLYDALDGSPLLESYCVRHGIESAGILTVTEDETAAMIAEYLAPRIYGRTVVEVGGGIGLLAFHLGQYAERVYCIEASPVWSSCFLASLFGGKPKNVSYLFGAAEEFAGMLRAEVALFCTHSGVSSMSHAASLFAPQVIDVYGELMGGNPERFDALALALRAHS